MEQSATSLLTESECSNIDTVDYMHSNAPTSQCNINTLQPVPEGFVYYAGILVFAPFLSYLHYSGFGDINQWVVSVLLGASNIEQTKKLNFPSLDILLGGTVKNVKSQRQFLKSKATTANIKQLLKLNLNLVGISTQSDFYYDPHSKHYTGLRNLLKGWCAKVKGVGKAIYMDFIHSCDGYPLYVNIVDNYDDMRIRFFRDVDSFCDMAHFEKGRKPYFVVDRAIFSTDVFFRIQEDSRIHLITWEKDYKKDRWVVGNICRSGHITRKSNNFTDTTIIQYQYQSMKWDKDSGIRQIIVRIPDPNSTKIIEVSILTDDLYRPDTEIIFLMFNRWVQENDFKYLIAHFGIDQITSYEYFNYQEIKEELEDKQYISGNYKGLTREVESLRGKLKTVLYKIHILKKKGEKNKLNNKQALRMNKLKLRSDELHEILKNKEDERKNTQEKVSKIEELIKQKKQKLSTNNKLLMDVIKIIARNIFYLTFSKYRECYNDKRDDLFLFRELSRSNGIIEKIEGETFIELTPEMDFNKKARSVIDTILENINEVEPELPCHEKKYFRVKLAESVDQIFAFAI